MEPIPRALQTVVALIVIGLFVGFAIWYRVADAGSKDTNESGTSRPVVAVAVETA